MSDTKPKKKPAEKPEKEQTAGESEINVHADCEQQITQLREQLEVLDGKYRRALADFANFERHMGEEQHRYTKLATQIFVEQMLVPYDHLRLAAGHLQDKGLDLVVAQFKQLFESQGLKEIAALGKPFDALAMEAVETREGEPDQVLAVTQPGFELNGIVIRPAQVVVGKAA